MSDLFSIAGAYWLPRTIGGRATREGTMPSGGDPAWSRRLDRTGRLLTGLFFAWCFIVIPVVLVVGAAWFTNVDSDASDIDPLDVLITMLGILVLVVLTCLVVAGGFLGYALRRRARRHRALPADVALQRDARPPVLYFRAFADEGSTRRIRVDNYWNFDAGEEEYLCEIVGTVGPVIAVGRPGDRLPPLGASRLYVPDEQWQPTVLRLLRSAALVVIRWGRGPGLDWELHQSFRTLPPARILLLVPGRDEYEALRARLAPLLPRPLPPWPGRAPRSWLTPRAPTFQLLGCIWFSADGGSHLEEFRLPAGPDIRPAAVRAEFTRTLTPLLTHVGRQAQSVEPAPDPPQAPRRRPPEPPPPPANPWAPPNK